MSADWQVTAAPYRDDRFQVSIERGQFVTGFDVTRAEAEGVIEALRDVLTGSVLSSSASGFLSSPPADDVREAPDSDVKALMGRLWAAADNAGISREAVEFEWPECHKPKCQGSHGMPDVAMSYMKRAIMAEIEAELRYRTTTRPDHAPDSDSPEQAAQLNLAILLSKHNVHDEGTFARAADRIIEAYPELVPVFSGEVRLRGTVTEPTDAQVDAAAHAIAKDDPEYQNGTYGIEDYRKMARAALEAGRGA
uniref:hypothetical protein n=1 Tax=Microbacterium proteolyticum TaxID=1572644 RepID=UPI00241687D4|nr:hypothetical protein [Microbacterium proteolyticum]